MCPAVGILIMTLIVNAMLNENVVRAVLYKMIYEQVVVSKSAQLECWQRMIFREFLSLNEIIFYLSAVHFASSNFGNMCVSRVKGQNSLFSLCMLTYTYELQDIIQLALKRLPGEGEFSKKRFVRFSPLFTCYNTNC
jgi:hypothetical protein